jgi:5-methylcytosine-specific restriction endonuclease McrA
MKKSDIKRHLNIYSIYKKRHTTINHAFASAISSFDNYEEKDIDKALQLLGQKPNALLKCLYCGKKANSWDHLNSLVKDGLYTGYGHQLGNLVPCCRKCNSAKGKKNFIDFVNELDIDEEKKAKIKSQLTNYSNHFKNNIVDINSFEYIELTKKYIDIKKKIFELLKLADEEAKVVREKLYKLKQ